MKKLISFGLVGLTCFSLIGPAFALEAPVPPGGETSVEIPAESGENFEIIDNNGNVYYVDIEYKDDENYNWNAETLNGNYAAEGGEETSTKINENASDVSLDLITNGESNGKVTETSGDASETIAGELKEDDSANYNQTTTTVTDRIVTGEVTAITTQTTIVTKEDGSQEQVTYYYYNAADEDFRWHENGRPGQAYFETTNNPGLEQPAGVYMLIVEKVITQLDEDGNPTDNVTRDLMPCVYCTDINTFTETGKEYRLVNLEDAVAEGYYSEEDAAHLRAIMSLGYDWGWSDWGHPDYADGYWYDGIYYWYDNMDAHENWNKTDKDVDEWTLGTMISEDEYSRPRGTQSLEDFKQILKTAVANGELDLTNEQIDALTRGQAATATQVAIWQFGKRDYTTDVYTKDDAVNAIAEWLAKQTMDADETQIIDQEKAIDDFQLVVGSMVKDHENNQDDNPDNNVYDTSLKFSLVVTPDKDKDDLVVKVVDSEGNVIKTARIAGEGSEGENYLTADEDGYYTFEGLELQENTDIKFNLTIEGTQYLKEGVYVFKSAEDGTSSQNLITKYAGNVEVNTTTEISLTFNVEESTITKHHEWRSEETKEDKPTEPEIPEEKSDKPEESVELEEPEKPKSEVSNSELDDTPQTGDGMIYYICGLLAGLAIGCLYYFCKKRK